MTEEQYQEYLKSEHWNNVKNAMLHLKYVPKCEMCGAADEVLDVHHITYEYLGNENQSDLCVLCHTCHEKVHEEGIRLKVVQDDNRKKYYDDLFHYLESGLDMDEAISNANKNRDENGNYDDHFYRLSGLAKQAIEDIIKYSGFYRINR